MILLDTHTLIWLDAGLDRLGTVAHQQLDAALQTVRLAVSTISFWETGMLVMKGRLKMSIDLLQWRTDLLSSGLLELPVSGNIGINAASLEDFHGDPTDRIIVATALENNALMATADEAILNWNGPINCLDARC